MHKPDWKEFDFKIASDYTHGSPEFYRSLLRHMLGLPELLPGEKNGNTQKPSDKRNSSTRTSKRSM
jgi:hypothetical protein